MAKGLHQFGTDTMIVELDSIEHDEMKATRAASRERNSTERDKRFGAESAGNGSRSSRGRQHETPSRSQRRVEVRELVRELAYQRF